MSEQPEYTQGELRFWGWFIIVAIVGFVTLIIWTVVDSSRRYEEGHQSARGVEQAANVPAPSDASGVQSQRVAMSFSRCLARIRETADALGQSPVNIVETADTRIVRFRFDDGDVLMTCDGEALIVTHSPG